MSFGTVDENEYEIMHKCTQAHTTMRITPPLLCNVLDMLCHMSDIKNQPLVLLMRTIRSETPLALGAHKARMQRNDYLSLAVQEPAKRGEIKVAT